MTAPSAQDNDPQNPAPFGAQTKRSPGVVYILTAAYVVWVVGLIYMATMTRGA